MEGERLLKAEEIATGIGSSEMVKSSKFRTRTRWCMSLREGWLV